MAARIGPTFVTFLKLLVFAKSNASCNSAIRRVVLACIGFGMAKTKVAAVPNLQKGAVFQETRAGFINRFRLKLGTYALRWYLA